MTSWLAETTQRIGDELNEVLERHEREEHAGEACPSQMLNIFAYLAHRTGLFPPDADEEEQATILALLLHRTLDYQAVHEEHILEDESAP